MATRQGFIKPTNPRWRPAHPLSRGMIMALTFAKSQSAHPQITYEVGPLNQQYAFSSAGTWTIGPNGDAYYAQQTYFNFVNSKRFEGLGKFTCVFSAYVQSTTGAAFMNKNSNSGLMLHRWSDNVCYFRLAGIGNSCNTAANDFPLQTWTQGAFRYDGATMNILINGVTKATANIANLTIPVDGTTAQFNTTGAGGQTDAAYDYMYFYNRALSQNELNWLAYDPFVMFRGGGALYNPPLTLTQSARFDESNSFYSHTIAAQYPLDPDYWTDSDTFYDPTVTFGKGVYTPPINRGWIDGNNFYPPEVTKAQSGSNGRPLIIGRNGIVTRYRKDHIK